MNLIKISFTGDIMSDPEQEKALIANRKSHSVIFENATQLFSESDLVVANLETPIAGEELGYTEKAASFNTPESILPAIKQMGVDIVTNANNHILDRGVQGLFNTIDALDKYGIEHTGCYKSSKDSEAILIKEVGGVKIAFISYTYGTNSEFNGNLLENNQLFMVDLLKKQLAEGQKAFQTKHFMRIWAEHHINPRLMRFYYPIEKICNHLRPYKGGSCIDTVNEKEIMNSENSPYIERLKRKVRRARALADIVVLCLHCGGQYNEEIGLYTKYVYSILKKMNIDLIVGNHPHCVLGCGFHKKQFYTYSLGNFSFSPGGMWYVDTVLAEYSIVLHAYIDSCRKCISNYYYSIVKNVIGEDGISRVYPVDLLLNNETDAYRKKSLLKDIKSVKMRFVKSTERKVKYEHC